MHFWHGVGIRTHTHTVASFLETDPIRKFVLLNIFLGRALPALLILNIMVVDKSQEYHLQRFYHLSDHGLVNNTHFYFLLNK